MLVLVLVLQKGFTDFAGAAVFVFPVEVATELDYHCFCFLKFFVVCNKLFICFRSSLLSFSNGSCVGGTYPVLDCDASSYIDCCTGEIIDRRCSATVLKTPYRARMLFTVIRFNDLP